MKKETVFWTAYEANGTERAEIENATCFDKSVYPKTKEFFEKAKTLVADLEEVLADESYDFDNIVPINYHEPELIRRFFELKVIRYRKILSENNFS